MNNIDVTLFNSFIILVRWLRGNFIEDANNKLNLFIQESNWIFAKTYAETWPHEYIVRDKSNESLFFKFVVHIRTKGYAGKFYSKDITYLDQQDTVYWTMGDPVKETIIINRCKKKQSYEYRLARNDLPS